MTMRVGTVVRLKRKPRAGKAKIALFYRDIKDGVKLDRSLDGFYSWNVKDLVQA